MIEKKKKQKEEKTNGDSSDSENEEDEDNTSITSLKNDSPKPKKAGFLARFKGKTKKEETKPVEDSSDEEDEDLEMQELNKNRRKSVLRNLEVQETPGFEMADVVLPNSPFSKKHRAIHFIFVILICSCIVAVEIMCVWRTSCSMEWWIPNEIEDMTLPTFASKSFLITTLILIFIVIPMGYANTLSEKPTKAMKWTVFAFLYFIYLFSASMYCFVRGGSSEAYAKELWDAGAQTTITGKYYKTFDAFTNAFYWGHLSFAVAYFMESVFLLLGIFAGIRLIIALRQGKHSQSDDDL